MNARPTFVPWDIEVARLNFGANCGPAAFAALMETEVCRVIRHFPHFDHSNWTNLTQMVRAVEGLALLRKCGDGNCLHVGWPSFSG